MMETLSIDRRTFKIITSLAHHLHTSEMTVVQQAIRVYAQKADIVSYDIPEQTKPVKLLQVGKHRPFKPFKAIKMTGEGPTASEMVLEDRR